MNGSISLLSHLPYLPIYHESHLVDCQEQNSWRGYCSLSLTRQTNSFGICPDPVNCGSSQKSYYRLNYLSESLMNDGFAFVESEFQALCCLALAFQLLLLSFSCLFTFLNPLIHLITFFIPSVCYYIAICSGQFHFLIFATGQIFINYDFLWTPYFILIHFRPHPPLHPHLRHLPPHLQFKLPVSFCLFSFCSTCSILAVSLPGLRKLVHAWLHQLRLW